MKRNLGIGAGLLVIVALGIYLFALPEAEPPAIASSDATGQGVKPFRIPREIPPPPPELSNTYELTGTLPKLENSDAPLLRHLGMLLSSVRLGLLQQDQFIRKLVLQVDNAARGALIYPHSPLIAPEGALEVVEENGQLFVAPGSYRRYTAYADLVQAVDTELLVAFYRFYEPLFDEAYTELGYPEGSFRSTLIAAIDVALGAPVVEEPIRLVRPEGSYLYADESLEGLNMVHKQLLRMGPENTARIQQALQKFKARIQ